MVMPFFCDYHQSSANKIGGAQTTDGCNARDIDRAILEMAQSARKNVTPRSGVTRKRLVPFTLSFPRRRESMGSTQKVDKRNRAAETAGSHKKY